MLGDGDSNTTTRRRKNRWGDAPPVSEANKTKPSITTNGLQQQQAPQADAKAKALALQESIRQRLAAIKSKTTVPPQSNKRPPEAPEQQQQQPPTKKAKYFELDMSVTAPTFSERKQPTTPKVNPYLSVQNDDDNKAEEEELDERLVRVAKPRQRHKALTFIEPGTFVEIAERKRLKAANAMESGFSSGRKVGLYVKATDMAKVYGGGETTNDKGSTITTYTTTTPRADANPDVRIPIMEWWDVELLPTKLKKQVTMQEGQAFKNQTKAQLQHLSTNTHETTAPEEEEDFVELQTKCLEQASLSYSKTAQLVQHIVPISTNKQLASQQPVLYLTKRERRRQRRLRRVEKQRELQDLQAAGLIPPPEPRLTLKNFIRVMGDQAFVDPSQMEKKLQEQMHARQEAHLARNAASRLTKEQRSAKLARKLTEDSTVVSVALFWVKDMSHPYHRAKVELNARQYNITGGVLECGGGGGGEHNDNPNNYIACVICEGGPKAIKRFTRLMLVRMKWTGTTDDDDNVEEREHEEDGEKDQDGEYKTHKFNPDNKCELVWTGLATRHLFKGFVFQSCETSDVARKVLKAKGVEHFWDQVLTHASGRSSESFHLKLASSSSNDED